MKIGSSVLRIIQKKSDVIRFFDDLGIRDKKTVIIKPNWVNANEGAYTDAKILDNILSCFSGRKILIESYTVWRNKTYTLNWPTQFIRPEAGELQNIGKHIKWIRQEDKWFFDYTGIGKVLKKNGAEYINITEEILGNRSADSRKIEQIVKKRFSGLKNTYLYGYVPQKILDLRGSILISLGKVKADGSNVVTLSTKNLFGLIPDPSRWPKYHGLKDELLHQNIIDINKIYRSIFKTIFINEGVFTAMEGPWPMELNPIYNWERMVGGTNSVEVDSITAYMMGVANTNEIQHLKVAGQYFGGFNEQLKKKVPIQFIKPLRFW